VAFGYNLRHPAADRFLAEFRRFYVEDRLFREAEFHDAYLFDRLRLAFTAMGHRCHDMAAGAGMSSGRHVFTKSALGRYMDHLKGARKMPGRGAAADVRAAPSAARSATALR